MRLPCPFRFCRIEVDTSFDPDRVSDVSMRCAKLGLLTLVSLSIFSGCDRRDADEAIVSYRAAKDVAVVTAEATTEPASPMTAFAPPAGLSGAPTARDELAWTLPSGWIEAPSSGRTQMRFADFQIDPADPSLVVTIIPLGTEASELLPNIARWQGQIGMPPSTSEADAMKFVQSSDSNGVMVKLIDLTSPAMTVQRQRLIAAIIARPEKTWFIKLQGAVEKVSPRADEFSSFVKSLRFADSSASGTAASATPQAAGVPQWVVPTGWQLDAAKPMRVATFSTSADAPKAAQVIVTRFASAGMGDTLENINRWRAMVELKPLADAMQQRSTNVEVSGKSGSLFEFAADASATDPSVQGKKMIVAMIPAGEQTWYIRFVGPAAEVDAQRAVFENFLKSIRW